MSMHPARQSKGQTQKVNSKDIVTNLDVHESFGDKLTFKSTSSIKELFVTLNWSGIPLMSETGDLFDGIKLSTKWKDKYGNGLYPQNLKQGDIFTQYIISNSIRKLSDYICRSRRDKKERCSGF